MATLNELGKNSASITYGPSATGAEMWPSFALFDQWLTNDTLQGSVTASGSNVIGVGTIFTTQLTPGDTIMIAGQVRTVLAISSDSAFTVTSGFSPAITLPSAVKFIQATVTGTVDIVARGDTSGRVNVTNGSATVVGTGTFFLSDLTNSVTTATLAGTVAIATNGVITGVGTSFATGADGSPNRLQPGDGILVAGQYFVVGTVTNDTSATVLVSPSVAISSGQGISKAVNGATGRTVMINGRVRQITAIASNISMTLNVPMDFTDSNLHVKAYPRGTVTVTGGTASVTGTATNFSWDLVTGDQVLLGDELRTFSFAANATTAATLTDYLGYSGTAINVLRQTVTAIPFKRDDTYINGSGSTFTTDLRVGDDLIIDSNEVKVIQIINAAQFRVAFDYSHSLTGGTVYKKRKLHGFVMEGSREGAGTGNKFTTQTTSVVAPGTLFAAGSTTVTVATATGFSQFGLIKIQGAGGPPVALTGQCTAATNTVTGVNTLFTTELHVGAEIAIAGQYLTVTAIASNTALTVSQTVTVAAASPIYRTMPLYTFIAAVSGAIMTLGHPIRHTVYSNGANPPAIYTPSAATDFLEYIYSAPNKSTEASVLLFNNSLDRKYVGFRFYPLATGAGAGNLITNAGSAYNLTVYERWVAAYGLTNGVGVNIAHLSDNTTIPATAATGGVVDLTSMSQTTGGFMYLFAKPRYLMVQGKTFANVQTQWLGCVEFERAQPEDSGAGLGTSSGINYSTGAPVSGTPGVAPWPCYAYINGNRFPVGLSLTPTLPVAHTQAVHGGVLAVPRVRASTGDLVGANAHVYSACTITTGRWGHLFELGGGGSYQSAGTVATGVLTGAANTIFQPHMGHMVPVYTNVYNSKRFMFSPVVVLGPSYDPDIRGRLYGLKVIPSALGTLMDTVSVTIDSNDFYDAAQPAADHWVATANTTTFRTSLAGTNFQSTRSLEDGSVIAANQNAVFLNSFRWAIPS
jgi:hypothetical protein